MALLTSAVWRMGSLLDSFQKLLPARNRFTRFLIAGATNTVFGFAIYAASILAGAPVWMALLIANAAGVGFNFFTTGGYVFRSLLLASFPRFVLAYLVVYVVNLKLIDWLLIWVAGEILAQAILALPMALISYLLMKRMVFSSGPAKGHPNQE